MEQKNHIANKRRPCEHVLTPTRKKKVELVDKKYMFYSVQIVIIFRTVLTEPMCTMCMSSRTNVYVT